MHLWNARDNGDDISAYTCGVSGATGVSGDPGKTGETGLPGVQGPPGYTGSRGHPGLPGNPGPPGIPASPGLAGTPGHTGATGEVLCLYFVNNLNNNIIIICFAFLWAKLVVLVFKEIGRDVIYIVDTHNN